MNDLVQGPVADPGSGSIVLPVVVLTVAVAAAVRGVWSPCGLSMVSAINPFTERSRGHRYWLTASWFVAGSVLGGFALGALAAVGAVLLSPVSPLIASGLAVGCCLIALAADHDRIPLRLPTHPRQVNERWLGRYRRWIYAAGFGAQIGCGFATYIMTAAVYLTVALAALTGSPALALTAGVVFGLVRGLAVLLSSVARTPVALRGLHRRLDLLAPWSLRVVMLVEAVAAVALAYLAAGGWAAVSAALAVCALSVGAAVFGTAMFDAAVFGTAVFGHRSPAGSASCAVPGTSPGAVSTPAAGVGARSH